MTTNNVISIKGRLAAKLKPVANIFNLASKAEFIQFAGRTPDPRISITPATLIPLLTRDVIGQNSTVNGLVNLLARNLSAVNNNRTFGTVLFNGDGTTASGKSELAKSLAKNVFEGKLIECYLNQYKTQVDLALLTGFPPGYMGSDKGGKLTQQIKELKSGVILFDEADKAHPDFYNILRDVCSGKIRDNSTGEMVDTSQFVVILTTCSNNVNHSFLNGVSSYLDATYQFNVLSIRSKARILRKFLYKNARDTKLSLVIKRRSAIEIVLHIESNINGIHYGIRQLVNELEHAVLNDMYKLKAAGSNVVTVTLDTLPNGQKQISAK